MINRYSLIFINLVILGGLFAQDVVDIASGQSNAGLMETTINADTLADGTRANPDRIYRLLAGLHFQQSDINVDNPTGTLTIVGEEGGKKPVVIPIATGDVAPLGNVVNGSLHLANVHWQGRSDQNAGAFSIFTLNGTDRRLTVEDGLFEFAQHNWFFGNNVSQGLVMEFRNNYFRDLFWDDQWWASRVFEAKVPIDTLIFENNTVSGSGMALLQQEAACNFALVNHNTFINNHAYVLLNNYYYEAYFTNNLFYNGMIKGEDATVIGVEPDKIPCSILGLDTITASILLPTYMGDENGVLAPYNDIGNYKVYTADNIYFNQSVLDSYYGGSYNDIFTDAPVSYVNWGTADPALGDPPYRVEVPTPWMNSRAIALYADHDNLVEENNTLDTDPGLNTEAMSTSDADNFAIWNRIRYEVAAETNTPDMSGYFFGDNDPTTIPGTETEDGDGITDFTDLIEDFSYTATMTSNSDGHSVGALHWTDEIDNFDSEVSLAAIKAAYATALSTDDDVVGIPSTYNLEQNYPNPFNPETSIKYMLPSSGQVKIQVFDIGGRLVNTLVDLDQAAGSYVVSWRGVDSKGLKVSSGIYLLTMTAGEFRQFRKMTFIR